MSDDTEVVVQKMVSECRRILERKARHEVLVTYEDLAREVGPKVGIRGLSAHDPRLSRALGDLSTSTYDRHKILLSVLVVKKEDRMPGGGPKTGFYGLAKALGAYPDSASRETVFYEELPKVFAHYRRRKGTNTPED